MITIVLRAKGPGTKRRTGEDGNILSNTDDASYKNGRRVNIALLPRHGHNQMSFPPGRYDFWLCKNQLKEIRIVTDVRYVF